MKIADVEIQIVEVAEGKGVRALANLHTVVQPPAHKTRALERFSPRGADDEDGVLALLQLQLEVVPASGAQHALADVGVAQAPEPQLDERVGTAVLAQLFGHHAQVLHRATPHQLVPGEGAARELVAGWLAHRGGQNADLLRHRRTRGHHDLVLRNHRDGGAGDGIQTNHILVGT